MTRFRTAALLLALISPALAGTVDVTSNSQVTVGNLDNLLFYIADPSALSSSAATIEMVLGGMPVDGSMAPVPGTSGDYVTGMLFNATIESADGSFSMPFFDPNANALGLPAGSLVLTPGAASGGSYSGPVDLVSGAVTLGAQQAAELFGSGEAVINIQNLGGSITFGYPGSTITNDFSASIITNNGAQSEGARVMDVEFDPPTPAPDPGTVGLLLLGLALVSVRLIKR